MADFDKALAVLLADEGGWSDNPADTGGETFRGISRVNWPNWEGWSLIDVAKKSFPDCKSRIMSDPVLTQHVSDFYRKEFWNPLYDHINSQELATKLFDEDVNDGVVPMVRILQETIGKLCAGPVVADGVFGERTLDFVNGAITNFGEERVMDELRIRVAVHYAKCYGKNTATQEQFLYGWMRRAFA